MGLLSQHARHVGTERRDAEDSQVTKLATRIRAIRDVEEFFIRVRDARTNDLVTRDDQNILGPYRHRNKLGDQKRVVDYVARFERHYPGFTCEVRERTGSKPKKLKKAHGSSLLKNVRATY